MRKNNKAFTMMEVLGAVAIIGILLLIAVPGISKMMAQFRENYYESVEDTTTSSAKDFYSDNKIYVPDGILKSSYVNVSTLIDKKYVDKLIDYKGENCSLNDKESYAVVIYKGNKKYEYKTCIKCASDDFDNYDDKYCDKAWLTNDNLEYDFGDTKDLYIYYGTPREEARELLLIKLNIVKKNDSGEELDRAVMDDEDGILPENIDELNTTPTLDSDRKKVIPLEYKMESTTQQLNAVIYRHKAPTVTIKKTSDNSNYQTDTWSNGVIITLAANDNFFELSNTTIDSFQWYIDGGWKNIKCDMKSTTSCSINIKENVDTIYKFRIVTNEGNISEESLEYRIKVDVNKPKVAITPNGGEPIVSVGSTTGNINFTLTTSDTGGSGIKSREYAVNTSNTTAPTSFTNFYVDSFNHNKNLNGNKYYVWSRVIDNAGNVSIEVWPSSAFHMKYEVKYDSNGGTITPGTQYKYHGEDLTLSTETPQKAGYDFKGWKVSSTLYSAGGKYKDNASATLIAQWELKKYTVTVTSNNTNYGTVSPASQKISHGGSATITLSPKTGYKYSSNDCGGTVSGNTLTISNVTSAKTCKVTFVANEYTITYNANGGSVSKTSDKVNYGSSVTLPTPTRTGYEFVGWYTAATSGTKVGNAGASYILKSNITVYAQWNKKVNKYTLCFTDEGWDETESWCETHDEGTVISMPHTYGTFDYWSDREGNQYYTGDAYTVLHDENFTAEGSNYNCVITFDPKGGTVSPTSKTIICGKQVGEMPTPTKTGYTFTGWSSSTSYYTSSTIVYDDVTLYAEYKINSYTITYNANGGSVTPTSKTVTYGTTVTLPTPTISSSGGILYTFDGWYTASSGGGFIGSAGENYKVTSDITVYAHWSLNEHEHSYEARTYNRVVTSYTVSEILSGDAGLHSGKYSKINSYGHWCSGGSSTESCVPSSYASNDIVPMYRATCEICGIQSGIWCPVHASGGSATSGGGGWNVQICDASSKKYSSDATSCIGKTEGWTLVSKVKPS